MISSCHDLRRYFEDVFTGYKPFRRSSTSECDIFEEDTDCFLCDYVSRGSTQALASHFHDQHIMSSIREYLQGSATNLDLVLLFHYSCTRHPTSTLPPSDDDGHSLRERGRFSMRYRTYWPGKQMPRPDPVAYPTITALARRVAVKEYTRYAAARSIQTSKDQHQKALMDAEQQAHWECRCSATFGTFEGLYKHLTATQETESQAYSGKQTLRRHAWLGDQKRVVVDTRRFSDLHLKVAHRHSQSSL